MGISNPFSNIHDVHGKISTLIDQCDSRDELILWIIEENKSLVKWWYDKHRYGQDNTGR